MNLLDTASEKLKIRVTACDDLVALTDDALFNYHLVFMHGRNTFRLTEAERKRLRTYLERGGMLLADSICTSRAFTESFRSEMALVFPERKLERIPADDPLLTAKFGGFVLKEVSRREPQQGGACAAGRGLDQERPARARRDPAGQPLGRDFLAVRPELRFGKTRQS